MRCDLPITLAQGAAWQTPGWALAVLLLASSASLATALVVYMFRRRDAQGDALAALREKHADERHQDIKIELVRLGQKVDERHNATDRAMQAMRRDVDSLDRRVGVVETDLRTLTGRGAREAARG